MTPPLTDEQRVESQVSICLHWSGPTQTGYSRSLELHRCPEGHIYKYEPASFKGNSTAIYCPACCKEYPYAEIDDIFAVICNQRARVEADAKVIADQRLRIDEFEAEGDVRDQRIEELKEALALRDSDVRNLGVEITELTQRLGEAQMKNENLLGVIESSNKSRRGQGLEVAVLRAEKFGLTRQLGEAQAANSDYRRCLPNGMGALAVGNMRIDYRRLQADNARQTQQIRVLLSHLNAACPERGIYEQYQNGVDTCVWCGDQDYKHQEDCRWVKVRAALAGVGAAPETTTTTALPDTPAVAPEVPEKHRDTNGLCVLCQQQECECGWD